MSIPYTMKTNSEKLQELHALVWRYRAELEDFWPTPTQGDALLFAFTEVGEAIDAHLRSNATYARNRDKSLSVLDELADAAMMLLTALGPTAKAPSRLAVNVLPLADYCYLIGKIVFLSSVESQDVAWKRDAWHLVSVIAIHPEMNLLARVESRLQRIKQKNMRLESQQPKVSA